jgi:hypothetical protein
MSFKLGSGWDAKLGQMSGIDIEEDRETDGIQSCVELFVRAKSPDVGEVI